MPDFLYFAPRILEIAATDRGWWPDVEVLARALKASEFQSWSKRHREAVLHYFDAVLDDAVELDQAGWLIDSWVCAWGQLFEDVSPYLTSLMEHPMQVVSYYEYNAESLAKGRLMNAFWDDARPAYRQVLAWFNSMDIRNMIKSTYGL